MLVIAGVAEKMEYVSSNAKIAAVDENGVITAKKAGTATITVTATGADGISLSAVTKLTVKKAPTKVTLSEKAKTIGVGEVVTLSAKLSPSGAYSAITWTSSDESVVQVNADGEICGIGEGTATVTAATFNGKSASCKLTVLGAPATLNVNVTELKLNTKKTYTLKTEVKSATGGACAGKLLFETADASIATVDANGKITAKKVGETVITVSTYNGLKHEVQLGVYNTPSKVSLNITKQTINKNETLQLIPTIAEDCYTTFTWSTSSKKIATVDANGLVTAIGEGTATITVKTANSKKTTAKITVVDPYKPTKIELAETGTVTLNLGETLVLNAAMQPATAQSELTWSTSSKKIATVADGVVTPVKEGTATITVKTYNGKSDTVKVKVVDPKKATAVELAETGTVTLNLGETLQLNAAVQPVTAETTLSWSSSSKKIATVDANGVVTPVKEGTATITVKTANGKKDTVKVKVVDPKKATGVELLETGTIEIAVGESRQLTANLQPITAETTLSWSTSSKSYATVDANGVVTGVKKGTATITVKTANGKKDTVKVKVVAAVEPASIMLAGSAPSEAEVGESFQLTVELQPAGAFSKITWSSSDPSVATVEDGVVNPVAMGSATITATTANGLSASMNLSVSDPNSSQGSSGGVGDIQLMPTSVEILGGDIEIDMAVTKSHRLEAILFPFGAKSELNWTRTGSSVLDVSADGVLTFHKPGTASVSVWTANNKRDTISVTVVDSSLPTSIEIVEEDMTVTVGESVQLHVKMEPENAVSELTWRSFGENRVSVDQNGVITVHQFTIGKYGIQIKVTTSNGLSDSIYITGYDPTLIQEMKIVYPADAFVVNGEIVLKVGESIQLGVEIIPETAAAVRKVGWMSDPNLNAVQVDQNGLVTAKKAGLGMVRVMIDDYISGTYIFFSVTK